MKMKMKIKMKINENENFTILEKGKKACKWITLLNSEIFERKIEERVRK